MQPQLDRIIKASFEAGIEAINNDHAWNITRENSGDTWLELIITGPAEGITHHCTLISSMFHMLNTLLKEKYWWKITSRDTNQLAVIIERGDLLAHKNYEKKYRELLAQKIKKILGDS